MAQDLSAGKPTEIDTINGEILHIAQKSGTSAPLNASDHELDQKGGKRWQNTIFRRIELCAALGSLAVTAIDMVRIQPSPQPYPVIPMINQRITGFGM